MNNSIPCLALLLLAAPVSDLGAAGVCDSFACLETSVSSVRHGGGEEGPAVPQAVLALGPGAGVPGRQAPVFDEARAGRLAAAARAGNIGSFQGRCYEFVANHMEAAGLIRPSQWDSLGIGPAYAADFAQWAGANPALMLRELGLYRMPTPDDKLAVPVGAILVYERGACGFSRKAGHIEVVTRPDQACSDGCQSLDQGCFSDPAERSRIHVIIPVN